MFGSCNKISLAKYLNIVCGRIKVCLFPKPKGNVEHVTLAPDDESIFVSNTAVTKPEQFNSPIYYNCYII